MPPAYVSLPNQPSLATLKFDVKPWLHQAATLTAALAATLPAFEPVYPLTEGLSGKLLAKAIAQALERLPELPEWQDAAFRNRHGWPGFAAALRALGAEVATGQFGAHMHVELVNDGPVTVLLELQAG